MDRKTLEHFEGCLLGGAVGDALGALLGKSAIPEKYLAKLELVDLIAEMAGDLHHIGA